MKSKSKKRECFRIKEGVFKQKFDCECDANEAMKELQEKKPDCTFHAYQCTQCGFWHFGRYNNDYPAKILELP
jgi:hypothetical protein